MAESRPSAGFCARLVAVKDDITHLAVDAVVNAAHSSLLGGGGVDGAIHRAAGPELLAACRKIGGCRTGEARITKGYKLPAKFVIHAVGPVWRGGAHGEEALLAACYENAVGLACENSVKSMAFPAISCGAYGYPWEQAVRIAVQTTWACLARRQAVIQVTFACFQEEMLRLYREQIDACPRTRRTGSANPSEN